MEFVFELANAILVAAPRRRCRMDLLLVVVYPVTTPLRNIFAVDVAIETAISRKERLSIKRMDNDD